jgi:hypothetical protein
MLDFFDYQMPDNQARDLKYQINQYLSEILIVTLDLLWYYERKKVVKTF